VIFRNADDLGYSILAVIIFMAVFTYFLGVAFIIFITVFVVVSIVVWLVYEKLVILLPFWALMIAGFVFFVLFGVYALIVFSVILAVFLIILYPTVVERIEPVEPIIQEKPPVANLPVARKPVVEPARACYECGKELSEKQYHFCMYKFGKPACARHQKFLKATPQQKKLYKALQDKGIDCELEKYDGYKSVDLAIPSVKLIIEVDGIHHVKSAKQMDTDIKRTEHSLKKGWHTIRYRNRDIEEDVYGVANTIESLVGKRRSEKK